MSKKSQSMLGVFMDGLPKTVAELPKRPVDEESLPYWKRRRVELYGNGIYSYNDSVNAAVEVVMTSVRGIRVLVCPACHADVEPYEDAAMQQVSEADAKVWHAAKVVRNVHVFARCEKCDVLYFLPELVSGRHFRLQLPSEDVSSYYQYLKATFCQWDKDDEVGHDVCLFGFMVQ
jgi:hypothetical protein